MKKYKRFYAALWLISLALFNTIVFVTPNEIMGESKFTGTFWVGYCFVTAAYLAQLACAYYALRSENAGKLFYRIPLLTVSYTGLIFLLIAGTVCMAVPGIPNWLAVVVCAVILAAEAFAVLKAQAAAELVSDADTLIKEKTEWAQTLTAEARALTAAAASDEIKAQTERVYEAIRYSDPVSDSSLADLEGSIRNSFRAFSDAVREDDAETAAGTATELTRLLQERNARCKASKK